MRELQVERQRRPRAGTRHGMRCYPFRDLALAMSGQRIVAGRPLDSRADGQRIVATSLGTVCGA